MEFFSLDCRLLLLSSSPTTGIRRRCNRTYWQAIFRRTLNFQNASLFFSCVSASWIFLAPVNQKTPSIFVFKHAVIASKYYRISSLSSVYPCLRSSLILSSFSSAHPLPSFYIASASRCCTYPTSFTVKHPHAAIFLSCDRIGVNDFLLRYAVVKHNVLIDSAMAVRSGLSVQISEVHTLARMHGHARARVWPFLFLQCFSLLCHHCVISIRWRVRKGGVEDALHAKVNFTYGGEHYK
jgi:hypothetical protein